MDQGIDRAALEAERTELREADEAIRLALMRVSDTEQRLRTAQDLSTADTWSGGGWFTSALKNHRVGQFEMTMRSVDHALEGVRRELADVGVVAPIRSVGTESISSALDVWFDNVVSDLRTHRRLKDASARLVELAKVLTRLQSTLGRRAREIEDRLGHDGA